MRRLLCALALALLLPLFALTPPAAADGNEGVAAPLAFRAFTTGAQHSCAVLADGRLKCWGANSVGQLGQGNTSTRGDSAGEMGSNLAATDLGTGRHPVAISAGSLSTCAILDNDTLKCWGLNSNGNLGLGTASGNRGDGADEMGDDLPAIDLGPGRTPVAVSAGNAATCAILDNGTLKCWGANNGGVLGLGDTNDRGDAPNEMGNNLPAVDLGPGRTATVVANPRSHVCAILDTGALKCWGFGQNGRLGYGDTTTRGDGPNEMGANLPTVDLGAGRTATAVATGNAHTCVVLDNGGVKCWGANDVGQLGRGNTSAVGFIPNQMGDNLTPIDLGPGRTATAVTAGNSHSCALLDNGSVKCWGQGSDGQLGNGSTNVIGDGPNEMGANLPPVDLGGGHTAIAVSAGNNHTCAVLDDASVRCWGNNVSGELGVGDTADRGEAPGEMGAALPTLALGGTFATGPAMTVEVESDDTEYVIGEEIDYTVTVTNTGGMPLTEVAVTDTDVPGCATAIGDLDVGTDHEVTCSHTAVEADVGTFTHDATADSDETGPVTGSSEVTVLTNAGVSIEVEADDTSYVVGEEIDYTLTVANTGAVPLSGVTITDTDVPGCAAVVGGLAVGAADETECSHTAVAEDIGTFEHTATVDSDQTEPVASPASQVTVVPGPSLDVTILTQEEVLVGDDIEYTVQVTNTGGVPLTGVTITDTDVPGCAGAIGDLAVSAIGQTTCTHTTVTADVGTFTHAATVDSDQTDPVVAGPVSTTVHRVRPDARIRLGGGAVAGNNVYNTTGANQGRSTAVGNRGTARFTVTAQNDGTVQDNLLVTGFGSSSRYLVTYKVGSENVTAQVTGDGFVFGDVDPGQLRTMTVLVTARNRIPRGAAVTRKVTVASGLTDRRDTVKLTVSRRR
jgi:uncharacterized repeat protein (TIGR01451 family)